jgi:hypothetical protein
MADKQTIKCPTCKGKGELEKPKSTIPARQRRRSDIANKLRSEGYTIREIMALMGYKSTTSVQLLLKK